jgi:hypothetical protein
MKRVRELVVQENHAILALIEDAQMDDIYFCIVSVALQFGSHDVLRGVWNLAQASKFWNRSRHIHRLLASTLFVRMDQQFDAIRVAYREWDMTPIIPIHGPPTYASFPWRRTQSRYLAEDSPFCIYRPLFLMWTKARFPNPVQTNEQAEIKDLILTKQAWCVYALLGSGELAGDHPELQMSQNHVFVAMARIMQISWRMAVDAIVPILCVVDHNESIPFLLFYLASCTMRNPIPTEESSRNGLEREVADTAYMNKRWNRKRGLYDRYGVLFNTKYLH